MMKHAGLIFSVFFAMLLAFPAIAQESLKLRAGEHDGYSRLVFDWPSQVQFTASQEGSVFNLRFNQGATLSDIPQARNIESISVQANDPLSVLINVRDGAKARSFSIGNRVIVDVTNPPGGSSNTQKAQSRETQPRARALQEADKQTPTPQNSDLKPAVQAESNQGRAAENLENIVKKLALIDENQSSNEDQKTQTQTSRSDQTPEPSLKVEQLPDTPVMMESKSDPIKITTSSVESIGMAAFETAGHIVMVTDSTDIAIRPQANGRNADEIMRFSRINFDQGVAFHTPKPDGDFIRGMGSGLLWTVMVSPEKKEQDPLPIQRRGVEKDSTFGASILAGLKDAKRIINMTDPKTGWPLKIVIAEKGENFAVAQFDFPQFTILPSAIGLAIQPKIDDLNVEITPEGVLISAPQGLSVSAQESVTTAVAQKENKARKLEFDLNDRRIFNFNDWQMGGLDVLTTNRNVIFASMADMTEASQIENLITLARMNLANGLGAEAIGFLNFAEQRLPELKQNPEFLSLSGASKAFDWKTDDAFQELSSDLLDPFQEVGIWKSFALADLGDWQQAYDVLPDNLDAFFEYPLEIRNRLGIVLAEVLLRAGEVERAKKVLEFIALDRDSLNIAHDAALNYLKGEAARQENNLDRTKKLWSDLVDGPDDLYRVKSGIALTRLLIDEGALDPKDSIDQLERLRYAWRGDELEAQTNYWLGRTYFETGSYIKGMKIMRNAAEIAPESVLGSRVTSDMQALFTEFYLGPELDEVSPLDAVALYEEFTELLPLGEEGNKIIDRLAEHMFKADLLDRAARLFKFQIDKRLSGVDAVDTAIRLAEIELINKKPKNTLDALDKTRALLKGLPEEISTPERLRSIQLFEASAISQMGQTDRALAILENMQRSPDVNRLRAYIAWQGGYWDDAAFALEDVILDENISLTRPLESMQAMRILQLATAMNLAGDRIGLGNLREKYTEAMAQTSKGRLFDVVTRERQNAGLSDRETLLSTVSEVDLFEDFLESYKSVQGSVN